MSAGRVREALARAEAGGRPPAAEGRERPLPGDRGGAAAVEAGAPAGGADPGPAGMRGEVLVSVRGVVFAGVWGAVLADRRRAALPGVWGVVFAGVCGAVWAGASGVVLS